MTLASCFEIVGKGFWRILKMILGIAALVGAVLVFTPAIDIDTVRYIVAAVIAIVALIVMFDTLGIERVLQKFRKEISSLHNEVEVLHAEIADLDRIKLSIEQENNTFKSNNRAMSDEVKSLQASNRKLVLIEKNAQQLIQSLMQAGDDFSKFGPILKESVGRMEDVNSSMERIVRELGGQTFTHLDLDGDGKITEDEFAAFVRGKK